MLSVVDSVSSLVGAVRGVDAGAVAAAPDAVSRPFLAMRAAVDALPGMSPTVARLVAQGQVVMPYLSKLNAALAFVSGGTFPDAFDGMSTGFMALLGGQSAHAQAYIGAAVTAAQARLPGFVGALAEQVFGAPLAIPGLPAAGAAPRAPATPTAVAADSWLARAMAGALDAQRPTVERVLDSAVEAALATVRAGVAPAQRAAADALPGLTATVSGCVRARCGCALPVCGRRMTHTAWPVARAHAWLSRVGCPRSTYALPYASRDRLRYLLDAAELRDVVASLQVRPRVHGDMHSRIPARVAICIPE